jgi:hypothetical protein
MSIRIEFPRVAASALLWFVLGACGDDTSEGGTGDSTAGTAGTSSGGSTGVVDSGSSGMVEPGLCRLYPTIPAIGDVFVSDGADGGPCNAKPMPCAGDPFGEWTLASSCGAVAGAPPNPFGDVCPGADYVPEMPVRSGTLSVAPSGAFELSTTTSYGFLFSADIACLGVFECGPEAEAMITSSIGGSASCTGDATACDCMVSGVALGSESTAGEGVTGERPLLFGNDGSMRPFCVSAGGLAVWSLLASPFFSGMSCTVDDDCETTNSNQVAVCTIL